MAQQVEWSRWVGRRKRPGRPPPGSLGLSTVHISKSYEIESYVGGNLLKLNGLKYRFDEQSEATKDKAKRGEIREMSRRSRQRMMQTMASINQAAVMCPYRQDSAGCNTCQRGLPVFVTLTYPGVWSVDPREWKRHLNLFLTTLRQRYPEVWGIWRLEFQARGAPHYHLLLWDGPTLEDVQSCWSDRKKTIVYVGNPRNVHNQGVFGWLSGSWYRIVASGDPKHLVAGTEITPIRSVRGAMYYVAKYMAKQAEGAATLGSGRYWGIIGRDRMPVERVTLPLTQAEWYAIKRVLRRRMERKIGRRVRLVEIEGLSTFADSALANRLVDWSRTLPSGRHAPF